MYDTCLHRLQLQGLRLTPIRKALLILLHDSQIPLSAPYIERRLIRQRFRINKTTVYRSLDLFIRLGLVTKTVINDRTQYYELTERGHHHHFVCLACDGIQDIPISEAYVLREAARFGKKIGFTITQHMLEFYGYCSSCLSDDSISAHNTQ